MIGLITNFNRNSGHLKSFAGWIDIEKGQPACRTKIILPHLYGATLPNANFQKTDVLRSPGGQQPVIDIKIMVHLGHQLVFNQKQVIAKIIF